MKINKSTVAALVAGVALGSTGVGIAAVHGDGATVMKQDQAVTYGNIHCLAANPATSVYAQMVCTRNDGKGLGVVVSARYVLVAKVSFKADGTVKSKKIYLNKANK